jgi:hypothetical protein
MKQNLSLLLLLIITLLSCKKEVDSDNVSLASMAKASTSTAGVYLAVDITPGFEIQDDNKGPYIHGIDRVDARILSDGNFFFQTNSNDMKTEIRKISFGNPTNYTGFTMNDDRNYTMRTNASGSLLNMNPGDVVEAGFTVRGIDRGGVVDWILQYRNGIEASNPETDKVLVTRNSDGSWTIEPAGQSTTAYANAGLYHADGYGNATGSGSYYPIPFKLTISKK